MFISFVSSRPVFEVPSQVTGTALETVSQVLEYIVPGCPLSMGRMFVLFSINISFEIDGPFLDEIMGFVLIKEKFKGK